ncbi:MAG: SpoIIE family protein phosphatase, partial [Gammaproteobacteria bacterium]|nr:SpoIIE family protein phosphatase [Gammaproteobacteria bacterium]
SGLFVAMAKSCVHTQARVAHTPAEIMKSLRRALSLSIQRRMLMTCCYVVIDLARKVLTYSNAGHPYPYLFTPETGALEKLEALDPILGALDEDAQE